MAASAPEQFNFPSEEEKILKLWEELDAFKNCLKQSKGKPRYSFYDGPPFATGLPHYGHILAGTIKDIVTRYAHQTGHHVERRFGWDCHGLPVEYEIDKTLGIKSPDQVLEMGIDKYNAKCREIVMRYAGDWEMIVNRLGRWIDFKNDYKTLYPQFMESIWWVFKQLFEKGLVYRGFKVMPYSTGCCTPLSNFESNQNYKEVDDPAVIVTFPLDDEPDVSLVAWTTTPWTLPSNLALCVHPDKNYAKIKETKTGATYILMEARLAEMYKDPASYELLDKFLGSTLFGRSYKPLFPYFEQRKEMGAFRVLTDTYVTEDSGTGVVHQAPAFGEDDYRVSMANGVIQKGGDLVCPVDDTGCFTKEVTDFAGQYVKAADPNITKMLKANGRLVSSSRYRHNYPFCWRSETPLIYKAVPSWFIRVEHIVDKLLVNNKKCYWVPEFVQEKRFHNWLENARDWAVSRNRFWGTPMPIWASEDNTEFVCIGSIDELERLSGVRVTDLHRESVDDITIPSKTGKGVLRRITPVFDCWFESGSMPYAQCHYPFENKKVFEESFPADFIAEGVDQTRGWFYTLLVISTALFDEPPYKNLIVNGLVLASDGKKMSKRLKNYPDPMKVVNAFGADALRLYLINSPVVRADTLRFKEDGVKDVVKEVFLPWLNAYRFLVQNVEKLKRDEGVSFSYDETCPKLSKSNIMDCWIVSFTQSLLKFVHAEMAAYRLYTVIPRLVRYIGQLTNWYVRFNRKRIKGETGQADCLSALTTLFSVLYSIVRIMAPFTPFLTEHMYQTLRSFLTTKPSDLNASVHYLMVPKPDEGVINVAIERSIERMQAVIELVRVLRDRKTMPTKYPLPEVVVIHRDQQYLDDVQSLEQYILEELNVKKLTVSQDKQRYGVQLLVEPDHQVLGKRLKATAKPVYEALKKLTEEEINTFMTSQKIVLCDKELTLDDVKVKYSFKQQSEGQDFEAHSDNDVLVLLDTQPSQEMLDEGVARAVVNLVQKLRKKAKLAPHNNVTISYEVRGSEPGELTRVVTSQTEYIASSIKQPFVPHSGDCTDGLIIEEDCQVKGMKNASLYFRISS